jgi:hypothetical protein
MSWIVLGLGAAVALIALVQTAISRRNSWRLPRVQRFNGGCAETHSDNFPHQDDQKNVEDRQKDTEAPR